MQWPKQFRGRNRGQRRELESITGCGYHMCVEVASDTLKRQI